MFPFHTWLPDAHTEAPTVGSVLLAAILLKLGTYGFIRIALPILPEAAQDWAPWIGLLAVIGIIYGALGCLAQTRHETAHRVLVGRAHGLRDARHRDAHRLRHQRRRSSAWSPTVSSPACSSSSPARCRSATAPARSSRLGGLLTQAPQDGLDPRLLRRWRRSGCPASPASGASSRRSCRRTSPARRALGGRDVTFRIYMVDRRDRHRARRRLPAVDVQRVAFGEPKPEFERRAHPRRPRVRVDRVDADAARCIVVLGIYPDLIFSVTDAAVHAHRRTADRRLRS